MVLGTIQGVMFLLIFRYVFGGAIGSGGLSYVNFLVPGFITTGILFTGMGAATAVAEDLEQGFVDRLRSLPIPRTSVLAGRAIADTAMATWSAAISVGVGFLVGFRLHGSVGQALEAFALLIVGWRCWCSPGRSSRVRSCRCRRCPGGCRPSPTTSRSRSWWTRCGR